LSLRLLVFEMKEGVVKRRDERPRSEKKVARGTSRAHSCGRIL